VGESRSGVEVFSQNVHFAVVDPGGQGTSIVRVIGTLRVRIVVEYLRRTTRVRSSGMVSGDKVNLVTNIYNHRFNNNGSL